MEIIAFVTEHEFPVWVKNIETVIALITVCFTLNTWLRIKDIRNEFLLKNRLPEIKEDLITSSSEISRFLRDWENQKNDVILEFSKVKSLLKNLLKKLPKHEQQEILILIEGLKFESKRKYVFWGEEISFDYERAWGLYAKLNETITTLEQLNRDLNRSR